MICAENMINGRPEFEPTQEQERIHSELNSYSELEAEEIIKYLKENEIKRDPKHQYEQMRKNGMFDD